MAHDRKAQRLEQESHIFFPVMYIHILLTARVRDGLCRLLRGRLAKKNKTHNKQASTSLTQPFPIKGLGWTLRCEKICWLVAWRFGFLILCSRLYTWTPLTHPH